MSFVRQTSLKPQSASTAVAVSKTVDSYRSVQKALPTGAVCRCYLLLGKRNGWAIEFSQNFKDGICPFRERLFSSLDKNNQARSSEVQIPMLCYDLPVTKTGQENTIPAVSATSAGKLGIFPMVTAGHSLSGKILAVEPTQWEPTQLTGRCYVLSRASSFLQQELIQGTCLFPPAFLRGVT